MEAWLPERVKEVLRAFLDGDARLSPAVRAQLVERAAGPAGAPAGEIPPALAAYADRVAHAAYRIKDEDIDQLRAQGHSEDDIFEVTIATAFGAGYKRLRKGLSLLRGGGA